MADNRVTQIVEAVKTALTGLTTTGSNVAVHRVDDITGTEFLDIRVGDLEAKGEPTSAIDWALKLHVGAYVEASSGYWETLLTIQKEVHLALRSDHTLGLSFVIDTYPEGSEPIEVSGEGVTITAHLEMIWKVEFRSSLGDISA